MRVLPGALLPCLLASGQPPLGKRAAPPLVAPVEAGDIRYRAPNTDGRRGLVLAERADSGEKLWELPVFETRLDPRLESDVQAVYIVRLRLRGSQLEVRDEAGRVFRVDLRTRAVQRRK